MKFRIVRSSTWETLEIVDKKDLGDACAYVIKWYGEDSDVDLEYYKED